MPNIKISPSMNCLEASNQMINSRCTALVIVGENDKLIGILTEKDIIRATILNGKHPQNVKTENAVTKNPITADHKCSPMEALQIMCKNGFRHLPLVDREGKFCDCVDIVKIARMLQTQTHSRHQDRNLFARFLFDALEMESHGKDTIASMIADINVFACMHVKFSVESAIIHMHKHNVSALNIIGDDNELEGILTETDIVRRVISKGLIPHQLEIGEVMTKRPILFISPTITRKDALSVMLNGRCRHLPIVDNITGVAVGIIDILQLTSKATEPASIKTAFKKFFASFNEKINDKISDKMFIRVQGKDSSSKKNKQDLSQICQSPILGDEKCDDLDITTSEDIIKPETFLYSPKYLRPAIALARDADSLLSLEVQENNEIDDLNNRYLKAVEKYSEALGNINENDRSFQGLGIQVKLLVRRGKANFLAEQLENAEKDLTKALDLAQLCIKAHPLAHLPSNAMDEAKQLLCEVLLDSECYERAVEVHNTIETIVVKADLLETFKERQKNLKDAAEICTKEGSYHDAIVLYTSAIRINKCLNETYGDVSAPIDYVLYSSRASCYMQVGDFEHGLEDSQTCTAFCHDFVSGWTITVECLTQCAKYEEVIRACKEGLELHPADNTLIDALIAAENNLSNSAEGILAQQKSSDPAIIKKLSNDFLATSAS